MTPERPFDIEGSAAELLRDRFDFGRRHEQEKRVRIDEAADEPGTGDAVDFRPLARYPEGSALPVARRQLACRARATIRFVPIPRNHLRGLRPNFRRREAALRRHG